MVRVVELGEDVTQEDTVFHRSLQEQLSRDRRHLVRSTAEVELHHALVPKLRVSRFSRSLEELLVGEECQRLARRHHAPGRGVAKARRAPSGSSMVKSRMPYGSSWRSRRSFTPLATYSAWSASTSGTSK